MRAGHRPERVTQRDPAYAPRADGSPNIHLRWLYGWFGCLRADRPVMAGQRARMPAHRALRAFPARRPERYRGEAGQQPACTGNPFRGR